MNDRDQRIIEGIPDNQQPRCSKCGHSPLQFACNMVKTAAGHVVAILWCGSCGTVLQMQFVGMEPPSSGIVRPS
jgi:hypothetical protein